VRIPRVLDFDVGAIRSKTFTFAGETGSNADEEEGPALARRPPAGEWRGRFQFLVVGRGGERGSPSRFPPPSPRSPSAAPRATNARWPRPRRGARRRTISGVPYTRGHFSDMALGSKTCFLGGFCAGGRQKGQAPAGTTTATVTRRQLGAGQVVCLWKEWGGGLVDELLIAGEGSLQQSVKGYSSKGRGRTH